MEIQDIIQKLGLLYQELLTKDLTPDEEAQAKVQLLEILSSIKAYIEVQGGDHAQSIINQTNNLKEMLLEWDPYGSAWFKEEKTLVDGVYNLLAGLKTLSIQKGTTTTDSAIENLRQEVQAIVSSLKNEIATLKNEVGSIKKSVIALAKAVKEKFSSMSSNEQVISQPSPSIKPKPIQESMPKPSQGAVPVPRPVPISIEPSKSGESEPISLPKPVPVPIRPAELGDSTKTTHKANEKPISLPKPEPVPIQNSDKGPQPISLNDQPAPVPIPLSGTDLEEPLPLTETGTSSGAPLFGALSSSKKEPEKKPDKEQLFSLFSGSGSDSSGSEEVEIIEEQSPTNESSQSAQLFPQGGTDSSSDPETLYQELISLEGKRYSIERSIRDLKSDRENGVISDHEYKEKLSQLLNKLQTISKRIGAIREKLD